MIILNQKGDAIYSVKELKIETKEKANNIETENYLEIKRQVGSYMLEKPTNYETKEVYLLVDENGNELAEYEEPLEAITILKNIIECEKTFIELR